MSIKQLELLHAAALEAVLSFEELDTSGDFHAVESSEQSGVLKSSFEAHEYGKDESRSRVTLMVSPAGEWTYVAESLSVQFCFETSGSLRRLKDPVKALEFIESLKLPQRYAPLEKPSALEAELAAAYAGFLKQLLRALRRGASPRSDSTNRAEPAQASTIQEQEPMELEQLLSSVRANSALEKLLRSSSNA